MGDEKLSTGIASEESFSLSMGSETEYEAKENLPVEADNEEHDEDTVEASGDTTEPNTQDEDTDLEDSEGGEQQAPEDLGEFDPEDTEKWDAQYRTEDGALNEEALSNEFWASAKDGGPGSLNEGTYAYLESLGVSKAMAKNVEAALVTQADGEKKAVAEGDGALFQLAGDIAGDPAKGADVLQAALDWGKGGGYTEDAQKKFNDAAKSKDPVARSEAVELLVNRYIRANPDAAPKPAKQAKPRVPQRDATKGQGRTAGGGKPFKSRSEYREARNQAGDNQSARREVAKRLAISNL